MKTRLSKLLAAQLIVWNVGQGQWVTEVSEQSCRHYDLGGERDVSKLAYALCREKQNYLYLSHWDWDHISFAARFAALVRTACLAQRPAGPASPWKRNQINKIPVCGDPSLKETVVYSPLEKAQRTSANGRLSKTRSNELSQVFLAQNVLIPGDSPAIEERKWSAEKRWPQVQGLILGHHGSRTSTSEELLKALPNLWWAVASARQAKYGHPHLLVRQKLKTHHIPLLRTEDWGHLHFWGEKILNH